MAARRHAGTPPLYDLYLFISRSQLSNLSNFFLLIFGQGKPQFIVLKFSQAVSATAIQLTFQGGFVGSVMQVQSLAVGASEFQQAGQFTPLDNSNKQTFVLESPAINTDSLRIVFEESSDPFGRVTVYTLDIIGTPFAG
jgi:hypothetical protein